ncbi:predicted protein [Nematostella vectensis]|uniref:Iduronate 2-sulfatase n=1 Tax=Nematostella vectensis TaxID=45351 RepID=A7SLQ8_NEMVE|nr:predicted protein [Nematostella vectensis]|eukprot:XP_001627441.1 predicted protein [Nematostella vectensis]
MCSTSFLTANQESRPPNVLLIIADDLRASLGCYGHRFIQTPYLDSLAVRSVRFTTSASQIAVCAPSRTSFLTSRRPDTLRLYSNKGAFYWRTKVGNFTTIPQLFKEAGYFTASAGKVFHPGESSGETYDYPYSWSVPHYEPPTEKHKDDKVCRHADGSLHRDIVCPVDVPSQPGGSLPDIQTTQYAINLLRQLANQPHDASKPFFLAIGFHKPHIPLKFPRQYLELYPLDSIPSVPDPHLPLDLPSVAYEPWSDIREREDISWLNLSFPYEPIPGYYALKIRQSYYAAVSYMDGLVGQVLAALDVNGFKENTVIVFLGDHGWALGEHNEWAKYSNFRVTTNVPLIVHAPGVTMTTSDAGMVSNGLVELVDLMPTLAEVCGLSVPDRCPDDSSKVTVCTEGLSFYPLLKNPSRPWKKAVFSQYPRPSQIPGDNSCQPLPKDISIMGYSLQTAQGRYSEWVRFDPVLSRANWSEVLAREFYLSPREDINVAAMPLYARLVQELSVLLRKGWRGALP